MTMFSRIGSQISGVFWLGLCVSAIGAGFSSAIAWGAASSGPPHQGAPNAGSGNGASESKSGKPASENKRSDKDGPARSARHIAGKQDSAEPRPSAAAHANAHHPGPSHTPAKHPAANQAAEGQARPQPAPRSPSEASNGTESFKLPRSCRQLLTVRSRHWDAVSGELRRYARTADSDWKLVGEAVPVNVGRRGMAWGRGLQGEPPIVRRKRERDLRAPAGAFWLGPAFGYAPELDGNAKSYPYLPIQPSTACVEQADSTQYNQIIDASQAGTKRWELRSEMLRPDGLFRWGVVVRQNEPHPQPGAGSCIFLHIWRGPKLGTAGCTAMDPTRIEEVIHWLDPAADPVLVQLPEAEYAKLKEAWELP